MSELTTKIQNVGIHACSDQTAITYIDAVNIREMMKQACIEAVSHCIDDKAYDFGDDYIAKGVVSMATEAIESVE